MTFIDRYYEFVQTRLTAVQELNKEKMQECAMMMLEAERTGHKIYTFGTGHSHMIGQDLYARAGGFAKFYPIVEIELTLATHPIKSTHIERCAAYADVLDQLYTLERGDVMVVTSNSGRNPLVVEYTMRAKRSGVSIIAITSLQHSKTIQSRHESGLRLFELADVVLDNQAPYGDAGVSINEQIDMGPISTLTGCYLAQAIAGRFIEELQKYEATIPVFRSSNTDGADAYNAELFERYVLKKVR